MAYKAGEKVAVQSLKARRPACAAPRPARFPPRAPSLVTLARRRSRCRAAVLGACDPIC